MPEAGQGVQRGPDFEENIPAAPTIAAIWAATGNILFAMEMDHSIATFTGPHENFRFIDKHELFPQTK
jgi:hypothetical protein